MLNLVALEPSDGKLLEQSFDELIKTEVGILNNAKEPVVKE